MPEGIPDAPWNLRGEAVALLASPLVLRLLVHYTESPVGPYDEHALSTLAWRGPHVFQMSVNSDVSRRGGREIWGYPKTLESLAWKRDGSRIEFRRERRHFCIRACGPQWKLALPFWTTQQKGDKWVFVPGKIKGRGQFGFRGAQLAFVLREFEMEIGKPK